MNFVMLYLLLALPLGTRADPEAVVKLGRIRGHETSFSGRCVEEYLGIPYAEPPIENLRFAKPQALASKWEKTFLADEPPPACSQPANDNTPEPKSEDCLYLNIWTPCNRTKNESLPVMFWIHGGGLAVGSGNTNGTVLSGFTETVVVTINYRLNVFGFLFGNNDDIAGNVGLYDQYLALKWVYENIASFGGNSYRITIFGESGGSWSVNLHLMHTKSWPYFLNAIMMSGIEMDYLAVDTKQNALKKAIALANFVGCPVNSNSESLSSENVDCLRRKDEQVLIDAVTNPNVTSAGKMIFVSIVITFLPIFGEDFIPTPPRQMWKEKHFKDNCSLLFGTVKNEIVVNNYIPPPLIPSDFMRLLLSIYMPEEFMTEEEREEFLEIHFIGVDEERNRSDALQAATQLIDDIMFHCPSEAFAEAFSEIESNSVYQYVFNYKSKKDNPNCDPCCPCHASDLPFTFGFVQSYPDDLWPTIYWLSILTDFVKTGTAFWSKYYRINGGILVPVYYDFKGNLEINNTKIGFRNYRCGVWRQFVLND